MEKPRLKTADRIAHLIAQRPRVLWLILPVLLAAAGVLIFFRARLNSEVLDMLPGHFESVQIYRLADREFSSARDLIIGLRALSDEVDMDGFTEHFAAALRREKWVVRVMDRSPLEAPGGLDELRAVALPLMLNQSDEDFAKLLATLQPDAITARLGKLRAKIESGVGLSQAELEYDPLGIVFPALKSLRMTNFTAGSDPHFRTVLVHCDQPDLNEPACNAIMRKFEDFKTRVLTEWKDGPAPEILCTGRTPYVAEMAAKMKSDITSTIVSSLVLVALTFYAGFRRWKPLRAIMDALLLCCVLAVACGAALFGELNMITIGLCAILVGLGVDFAMILYALYLHEREAGHTHEQSIAAALRVHATGIWFGALTTAAAFLCLLGSDSLGYRQLGVLIACGILIAAGVMMTYFWLFLGITLPRWLFKIFLALLTCAAAVGVYFTATTIRSWTSNTWQNIASGAGCALVAMAVAHSLCKWIPRLPGIALTRPWKLLGPASAGFVALAILAIAPIGRLVLDLNPKSLEPRNSVAGHALRTFMAQINPSGIEIVLAVIRAPDAESLSAAWQKAHLAWSKLTPDGDTAAKAEPLLASIATPAGLATSPARMKANAAKLAAVDFPKATAAFDSTLTSSDFAPEQFAAARGLLGALAGVAHGGESITGWKRNLPESSAWWFLIDGFLSREHSIGIARITPSVNIETGEQAEHLRAALAVPGIEVGLSGWGYTLAELGPWSEHKMTQMSALMVAFNIVLLTFLLRALKPVLILMLGLALSVGALIATLKFAGISLNLFNILAFPLVLGVGVDYGIYIALALRSHDPQRELGALVKPVLLSGLTTVVGFGSLAWAQNPALRGLGLVCGIGVAWCVVATFVFVLPACALISRRER
ncbi:MAG: MMPL family transporter [Chthoniobacteraceae bacterium]